MNYLIIKSNKQLSKDEAISRFQKSKYCVHQNDVEYLNEDGSIDINPHDKRAFEDAYNITLKSK